ncbi:MAG: GtrA family protein, partial [Verrucomicrobia bacterium]|nr:GtrA family protein [Cytophagales bacterium]
MILNELLIARLLKFGTVGFSSVAVDFAITYLCKEKLGVQKFVASAIGFYVS